jgi:hypothetical protein
LGLHALLEAELFPAVAGALEETVAALCEIPGRAFAGFTPLSKWPRSCLLHVRPSRLSQSREALARAVMAGFFVPLSKLACSCLLQARLRKSSQLSGLAAGDAALTAPAQSVTRSKRGVAKRGMVGS